MVHTCDEDVYGCSGMEVERLTIDDIRRGKGRPKKY